MNISRNLIILLTRIPPRLMICLILGLGIVTTWLVTGEMDKRQRDMQNKIIGLQKQNQASPHIVYVERPAQKAEQPHPDFQDVLKPGYRAVSVPVEISNGSTRFMTPGSHVDVVAIVGSGEETEVVPILSDIEVVAVGSTFQKNPAQPQADAAGSVTLSVSPADAAKLLKGQAAGKLCLTLRSEHDRTPLPTFDPLKAVPRDTPARVLPPPPPVVAASPPVNQAGTAKRQVGPQVEVWAGSHHDVVSFRKEGD